MASRRQKQEVLAALRDGGIVPVIRADSADTALRIVDALVAGGIRTLEITMTVPDAIGAIKAVADRFGSSVLLGAGTVTSRALAEGSLDAGAEFLVTPCVVPEVIAVAKERDVAVLPGAMTPTEVFTAWSVRRRHRQDLPGEQRRRGVVPEGAEGAVPANPALPDRRREPADDWRVREGRRVSGWRRRRAGVESRDRCR